MIPIKAALLGVAFVLAGATDWDGGRPAGAGGSASGERLSAGRLVQRKVLGVVPPCRRHAGHIPVITAAAALREVYGPHAAKKIAREFGVAIVTAKVWLADRFPAARRDELAARIRAKLDARDELSAEIRRQWASGGIGEEANFMDRRRARADRRKTD